jgi:hypothetical protein
MTGEEKAAQIGAAVQKYQDAKVCLAHLDRSVGAVAEAYTDCGESLKRNPPNDSSYSVENGKLKLTYAKSADQAELLLDEAGLIALLDEREQARIRLKAAGDEMKSHGITSLE